MRTLFLGLTITLAHGLDAQIAHGGSPIGWGMGSPHATTIPAVQLPALDRQVLAAQDQQAHPDELRYGVQRFLSVDVMAQAQVDVLPDDRQVRRVRIQSPGAVMLSVQFDQFDLAPGAWVFLYDADRHRYLGGFTEENEQPTGGLATAVVPGDEVVIEVQEPAPANGPSLLHVASITHGYRDIFHFGDQGLLRDYDPGYQSSPCHNNVSCPIASTWQQQKRAVAMFLRPDGNGCTGILLNNTAQDGTPYFHAANHCYTPTEGQWVFYFNYESPTCVGTIGNTTQTLSGATLKSNDYFDDFCLVQLNNAPPSSYQPFYAGWSRSTTAPSNTTVIHHPLYDVKKITFDNSAATSTQVTPYTGAPFDTYCWKSFWDSGIVEAVSSGAPLFDQNKRFVGHMYDGAQDCSNASSVFTLCAKFNQSWDGSAPSTRLRDWLDPANTTTTLNGFEPASTPLVKVRVKVMLEGPYSTGTQLMTDALRSGGLLPLSEPYTGLGYVHVNGGGGESTTSGVLAATGNTAVVDWVVVELRNKNNASQVLATRSALLLRTGSVVDVDGTSDVTFTTVATDDHYVAVRHRNHLGIMTQNPVALSATATLIDFPSGAATAGGTASTKLVGTARCLYAGDVSGNGEVKYTGSGNDRDLVLARIGGTVPTNSVSGYHPADVNMDGIAKYSGNGNDRDIILVNIGGVTPTSTLVDALP
ncbi:MAG: hypothetical protein JNL05_02330 [Flavobacteriales bacterium]|nr:hypothetical protein [Flavobacteriales bacterium]